MRKEIEWINDETLKSHVEKHVKGKNEKAQWESLYLNKYHKNLNDMIANAEDEEIIDIYEMESKQIHKEGDKIYLHIDKKLNKCINVSRYTDNFTTG